MATITVNPDPVLYTLSNRFWGTYVSDFNYEFDFPNTTFRNLFRDLEIESCRINFSQHRYPAPNTRWTDVRDFFLANPPGEIQPTAALRPTNNPSSQSCGTVISDVAPDGSAFGVDDAADMYEFLVTAGLNVGAVSIGNECSFYGTVDRPSDGGPWPPGVTETVTKVPWAIDWQNVHHRLYANAIRARATSLSKTVHIGGNEMAGLQPDGYEYTRAWIQGDALFGTCTWPHGNNNITGGYTDRFMIHIYANRVTSDLQEMPNAIFFYTTTYGWNNVAAMQIQRLKDLRTLLNDNGGSAIPIELTEYSMGDQGCPRNWISAAGDALGVIALCEGNLATPGWNVTGIRITSYSRGVDTDNRCFFTANPNVPNVRYYSARDMTGRFCRLYKRLVSSTVTGSGNTPPTGQNNSVPRVHVASGLNADGSKLGIFVGNADVSTSEVVTVFPGVVAQGQVTGVRLPQNQPESGLPSIAPFSYSGSFQFTLGPAEVWLFEIPLSPGEPPPPDPGTDPHVGNFATAIQINASSEDPEPPPPDPPSPDQHVGNFSTAIQINAGAETQTSGADVREDEARMHDLPSEWGIQTFKDR